MKPKYGPEEKPYAEDINDLVEENIIKGGVGSGKRGHKTLEEIVRQNRLKATNQISAARVEAMERLKRKPTPADEGNMAAREEAARATGLPAHGRGGPISMNEADRKTKKDAAKKRREED